MKKPSDKQVRAEIEKLLKLKGKVPPVTFFGDSNIEKINAQIRVLEERMTEDEVYENFEDDENPDITADIVSNAREAALWLVGEAEGGAPSKEWESLAN